MALIDSTASGVQSVQPIGSTAGGGREEAARDRVSLHSASSQSVVAKLSTEGHCLVREPYSHSSLYKVPQLHLLLALSVPGVVADQLYHFQASNPPL